MLHPLKRLRHTLPGEVPLVVQLPGRDLVGRVVFGRSADAVEKFLLGLGVEDAADAGLVRGSLQFLVR
jgi:hypothetical protein